MSTATAPITDDERDALRALVRRFVDAELTPHIDAWERDGRLPRALYRRAGELGLLGLGFPEEYGGSPGDHRSMVIVVDELARAASGGLIAGLLSHGIGAPPIVHFGTEELKARVLPAILAGEAISALAITEPGGGSDVANLQTRARRDGDDYVIDGAKVFITSGVHADYITTAVRTGGPGLGGISLLLVPGDAPGLARTPLDKMGWRCSDTAALYFDGCRVPARNLLGEENHGFLAIMRNFNGERLMIAAMAAAFSQVCLDEALAYARERQTFGKPLIKHQVVRHRLVDMATRIAPVRALLLDLAARCDRGEWPIAEICMLKNAATACFEATANDAVQLFGGAGYMVGTRVERLYRATKVLTIGGGASEIMKDLAARQLGW